MRWLQSLVAIGCLFTGSALALVPRCAGSPVPRAEVECIRGTCYEVNDLQRWFCYGGCQSGGCGCQKWFILSYVEPPNCFTQADAEPCASSYLCTHRLNTTSQTCQN